MFERALETSSPQEMWQMLFSILFVAAFVMMILVIAFILVGLVRDRRWTAVWTIFSISTVFFGFIGTVAWNSI